MGINYEGIKGAINHLLQKSFAITKHLSKHLLVSHIRMSPLNNKRQGCSSDVGRRIRRRKIFRMLTVFILPTVVEKTLSGVRGRSPRKSAISSY